MNFYMSMDSQLNGLSNDMQHWLIGSIVWPLEGLKVAQYFLLHFRALFRFNLNIALI